MTWRIPKESWIDQLLKRIGKRRAVFVSDGVSYRRWGPYGNFFMVKESWIRAFLRPKGAPLPLGSRDLYELLEELKTLEGRTLVEAD